MTLWLLSLLEPNSWPKMCRRIIRKSYFTSNCSSLCLGSCRWCVLRRYNSHPFLSRLLQFCLYQLFPMSDLVTKLFASSSSCLQKCDTHIMLYMPMYTYETSVRQLAPEIPYPWRQIYVTSITLIEFQTIIWKKCHWLIFWLIEYNNVNIEF